MHLAVKVVSQPAVVVEPAEVGAADIADLQLLVAGRARGVGQGLELLLALGFLLAGLADAEELVLGAGDFAHGAEDFNFEEAAVNGRCEVRDGFELFGRGE